MQILLNATPLKGLLTGISRYLQNLYLHIEAHQNIETDFYEGKTLSRNMPTQANPDPWIKTTDRIWKLPDFVVLSLRSIFWLNYEKRVRKIIKTKDYDIYHETAFTPASIQTLVPQVFTLHDLSLIHYRDYHPKERVWFSDLFYDRRISKADHIIVPSKFIKDEVCSTLAIPENQVTAIPEAAGSFFSPRSEYLIQEVKKKFTLPESYILFVGTLEPRKNVDLIIEALSMLNEDISLVLVGWKGWGDQSWLDKARRYHIENKIYMLGYIDEHSLACLYSGATALIYPSIYEGFGLPVLEAMACGCPVICSNAASLPEVGGDAALYIDPSDVDGLCRFIQQVTNDKELREELKIKSLEQASRFSWEKAAAETIEVFQSVKNG